MRLSNQHYNHLPVGITRYAQLATDLNATPLYSLFVNEANFTAAFLQNNFTYNGGLLNAQTLLAWLQDPGLPAFETHLQTNTVIQGVNLRRFLFLALIITLLPDSPVRNGAGTVIGWNVLNEEDNQLGTATWRPPAIALAHELMHALHNGGGDAPGYDDNNFATTAAELQAAGIIPFNNDPVSENKVRAQWGGVNAPAPDPTNAGATPRRTVYTAPAPQTAAQMRGTGIAAI